VKLELRCYGTSYAVTGNFTEARQLTWQHVWKCPEGPMSWARPVKFQRFDDDERDAHGWVTSAGSERLDHTIVEVEE
jgi:hypothetical protein